MSTMPEQFARFHERPAADALSRGEVAEVLGVSYARVYYWTAPPGMKRRAVGAIPPSYGEPMRKGEPAWFSPADVDELRELFQAEALIASYRERNRPSRSAAGGPL